MESFLENSRSSHFKVSRGPENFHENITVNQLITILVDTNLNTYSHSEGSLSCQQLEGACPSFIKNILNN